MTRTNIKRSCFGVLMACGVVLGVVPVAWSEPGCTDQAKIAESDALHREGKELFIAGDYEGALLKIQAAQDTCPHVNITVSLAACHQKMGNLNKAKELLEQALLRPEADKPKIEGRLSVIEGELKKGDEQADLKPQGDGSTHASQQDNSSLRIWSYVSMGVGVVGIGAGVGILAASQRTADKIEQLDEEIGTSGASDEQLDRRRGLVDELTAIQTVDIIAFSVGGVALATGAVLFFVSGEEGGDVSQPGAASWNWFVGPSQVGVFGTF